jgi:putative component of toxin-antitoxin plasmid stabilization module
MRPLTIFGIVVALACPAIAGAQVADSLRQQAKIRETILVGQVEDLAENRVELREAWTRLEQQTSGLMEAQREGETVDSLRLRDEQIREVEADMIAALSKSQQLRRSMLENRTMLAAIDAEVQRLAAAVGEADAPLNGTWRLVMESGQEGLVYLQQQGTLVSGTYALSGGFTGSLRGTFVSGKVRLERIDSQIGFAAIFYGRLVDRGQNPTLQGNWEATQLASGLPSRGAWTAHKVTEIEE